MSTLMVHQQPVIPNTFNQNQVPIVHILTSRSENDEEKV